MLFLFGLGDRLVMMACSGAGGPAAASCPMSLIITGIFFWHQMFDGGLSFCHAAPTAQQQKLHFECAFFSCGIF